MVERGEHAEAKQEAVLPIEGPDDLTIIVDALCKGDKCPWIVDGGVHAAAEEEAVLQRKGGVGVRSDDPAAIDGVGSGAVGGQGIVDGGVIIDWHGTASSM